MIKHIFSQFDDVMNNDDRLNNIRYDIKYHVVAAVDLLNDIDKGVGIKHPINSFYMYSKLQSKFQYVTHPGNLRLTLEEYYKDDVVLILNDYSNKLQENVNCIKLHNVEDVEFDVTDLCYNIHDLSNGRPIRIYHEVKSHDVVIKEVKRGKDNYQLPVARLRLIDNDIYVNDIRALYRDNNGKLRYGWK